MRKPTFVLFCTLMFIIQSCQKYEDFGAIDRIEHTPEFAVPLVNSSLSLDEILEDEEDLSFLNIETDGSMSMNYIQEPIQQEASELIQEMEDFPIVLVDSFMSVPVQLFENIVLEKLHLKSGSLAFDIQSSHTEDISLNVIFPGLTKDGIPFQVQTSVDYQGSTPAMATIAPESIQDFSLALPNGNLDIRYEAYNTSGERVLLDLISGEAKDWEYSTIEGVWANESFMVDQDTIEIDVFESWVDGQISFENPSLMIQLSNSIGFPAQLKVQNMYAHTESGVSIPFTSIFSDGVNINYPALNEMGQTKTDEIILDKTNSNIISVFNARPVLITYEIVATMNPENTDATGFISEDSQLSGNVSLELPIHGTASGFTMEKTSDFEMDEISEISSAEFKLITNNGIPVDLGMQLYFTDENDNAIDSLFDGQKIILAGPSIGANGTVVAPAEQSSITTFSADRIEQIQTAKKVKVVAKVSTANEGSTPVKILTSQKVEVRLGAKFGLIN